MRPNTAFEGSIRPRKQSTEQIAPSPGPTTFFLATESDLDRRGSSAPASQDSSQRTSKDTIEAGSPRKTSPSKAPIQAHPPREGSRRRSTIRPKSIEGLRHEAIRQQTAQKQRTPGSLTPDLPSSQEPSLPSSPKSISSKSLPKSDDDLTQDESSSQAIESEDDEGEEPGSTSLQDSAPQLIMPSIRMPSRRPFTERGKKLGKFKILVAGSRGSGKTSLIKSIVQSCEDIVHVDPLGTSTILKSKSNSRSTADAFHETYASTRPYPAWWNDVDESRILKRRKSMGDFVLERNLCFVDTSRHESPSFAAYYIEQQLLKTINYAAQATSELTGLLSGLGGSQVDLVLYLVSHDKLKHDVDYISQLSSIANVVPLIAKSDLLTPGQIDEVRAAIPSDTSSVPRLPMSFDAQASIATATAPYSVSCVNGPDYDTMDASLLMGSEYVQPLLPSELHSLIDQILDSETAMYLRHLAARKLTSWYNSDSRFTDKLRTPSPASARIRSPIPSSLNSPLQASLSASGVLVPITSHSELSLNTSNSFALAKVADHTHKEERLAHIRLSKWASDLQLSLQREREKYENIARSERALWLVERMGEEIKDGQLVPITNAEVEEGQQSVTRAKKSRRGLYHDGSLTYQVHDPLGLLKWQDVVSSQTWLALQIVGSFGVVGGLALFATKAWGYETSFHQWARDWGVWHD